MASALAVVACGGAGDPDRVAQADAPSSTDAPALAADPLRAKTLHALTPVTGRLGQELQAQGWKIVSVQLSQLADTSIEVLYVDVQSEEARSEALQDALVNETRPILFDSHQALDSRVIKDAAGRSYAVPDPSKVDEITPLGSYLAKLTGFGANATAVLIQEGEELPLVVDGRGQINGEAPAALQHAAALGGFVEKTRQRQLAGITAAAANNTSGTLILTGLADKPRSRRPAILAAAGRGESGASPAWGGPVNIDPRNGRVFELNAEYWGGTRFAGWHVIEVDNRQYGGGNEWYHHVAVSLGTVQRDGGTWYPDGVPAGTYRMNSAPLKWVKFPDDTALWGPMFQAFVNGVYAGGGGTDWRKVFAQPTNIDDTTASESAIHGRSWFMGPSASFSVFGLFNLGYSASTNASNTAIRKTSAYRLDLVDLPPVGLEWIVSVKNSHGRDPRCYIGRAPSCNAEGRYPAMFTKGWAPNSRFEFRSLNPGCHVPQVNVTSYQGGDLVQLRFVGQPRGFPWEADAYKYIGHWDDRSPRFAAAAHTVNLPRKPGC